MPGMNRSATQLNRRSLTTSPTEEEEDGKEELEAGTQVTTRSGNFYSVRSGGFSPHQPTGLENYTSCVLFISLNGC